MDSTQRRSVLGGVEPANLAKFASDLKKPTQGHIHCVVRTPNGNDYGKDLLRQHYLAHPHTQV